MYRIRKKLKFEMAHILEGAYSKCCSDTIHGHSYEVELFFESPELNADGMVIDFGEIKQMTAELVNRYDHALLVPISLSAEQHLALKTFNKKLRVVKYNPTAENMAHEIFDVVRSYFPLLRRVRLHETDTGYAEYSEGL